MKTIKITDIETCPKYFIFGKETIRVNKETITMVTYYSDGYDIQTFYISALGNYRGSLVEPITKSEFAIELNKAYAKISGFKHIEELWKDEEADTHNTEEIDLLSQCELFIAGVQSYLGDDSGKELLEKIKNYKK